MKILIKSSLFFYTKQIKVQGKENIPKKGAVLFMVNHPNGLIDPLIVAVNNPRILHFLVRAAVFKNPFIKKFLATLNLMPIYRIRDGVKQLGRNQEIFEKCFSIFNRQGTLMIFPEGSHNKKRTIRPLSKGFTRILFGALAQNPYIKIHVVPVGITYQNPSCYPSKVTLNYGKSILANKYYDLDGNHRIKDLKNLISNELKKLSVHIPDDDEYSNTLEKLNQSNVDFTNVSSVNKMIQVDKITSQKRPFHWLAFLKPIIIINTFIPWLIWKYFEQKNDEFEFIDTFRFAFCGGLFGLFYLLQATLISSFLGWEIGLVYLVTSLVLVLLYSKLHPTPAPKLLE